MPKHLCIEPHDPYAQGEVLLEFEPTGAGFRLVAVIDDHHGDILPDLVEAQCDDLRCELAEAGRLPFGFPCLPRHPGAARPPVLS